MPTFRAVIQGTHPIGDVVQWGFHVQTESENSAQVIADSVAAAWAFYPGATNAAQYTLNQRGTLVRAYRLSAAGLAEEVAEAPVTPAGTATKASAPQLAVVVSLSGGVGAGRNGRFYLPAPNESGMGTNGRIDPTVLGTIANGMESMIEDVNLPGGLATVSIVSRVSGGVARPSPLITPVTSIRVGDVLDTQRRRRNGAAETYTSRSISLT